MFDIEAGIQQWKRTLLASEALRAEDVDELEDHLREEHARLRAGVGPTTPLLSEEESFLIAMRRLGRADALGAEFAKADPNAAWRRRWILMFAGYLGISLAFSLISLCAAITASTFEAGLSTGYYASYGASLVLGFACVAALARKLSSAGSSRRLPGEYALKLLRTPSLVALTLAAIAIKATVTPITGIVTLSTHGSEPVTSNLVLYPQVLLWLAPFILLALLVWHDRERLRREVVSTSDEASI